MSKLNTISGKQFVKALSKIGYYIVRQRGSHIRMACDGKRSVTIPNYREMDKSLIRKILRDIELTDKEFEKLL